MYRFCSDLVQNMFRFGSDEIHFRLSAGYFLICNVIPIMIWYWAVCTMADFKYGINTDVNIGVSVTRGGNTLFEVMGIC